MTDAVTRLNPPTLPDVSGIGYSQISIMAPGRIAHVSGQVAVTRDGAPTPGDLPGQARMVAANLRAALDALSASGRDVVSVRIYVTDLTEARVAEAMPHLMPVFDGARPSLTGIGVAALAAPDLQLEIEMVVRLPD